MIPLLEPVWSCPNCTVEARLPMPRPGQSHLHACRGLRGLLAPLLPAGTKAKVEAVEREDYVKDELVQLDPERGRPVMAVVTTRDDGQDTVVFAPTARADAKEHR